MKSGTKCELLLRKALWRAGIRYRLHGRGLPGRPDLVFGSKRLVVFCDGDFWHGRDLEARLAKLANGHNAPYWMSKIRRNVERDHDQMLELNRAGWAVLRIWEGDILRDVDGQVMLVARTLNERGNARAAAELGA